MAAPQRTLSVLERNWNTVDNAIKDLEESNFGAIPAEGCNSVAWLMWHMYRVLDTFINTRFQSKPQVWIDGGWYGRFGMSEDPENRGVGWTAEQVSQWTVPSKDDLVAYSEAVRASAREYLSSLADSDLDVVKVIPPVAEPRSVGDAMEVMIFDNISHGGQIAYLRGYFQGRGWMSA